MLSLWNIGFFRFLVLQSGTSQSSIVCKGNGKAHPITCHEGTERGLGMLALPRPQPRR
jgi:hypothetical protein